MAGKAFPAFPAHAQPAHLRIWQEPHSCMASVILVPSQYKDRLSEYEDIHMKIRLSWDRRISMMGILYWLDGVFILRWPPRLKLVSSNGLPSQLNQCWLLISEGLWHWPESNFTANILATILYNDFKNCTFKIVATYHRGQWMNQTKICLSSRYCVVSKKSDFGLELSNRREIWQLAPQPTAILSCEQT